MLCLKLFLKSIIVFRQLKGIRIKMNWNFNKIFSLLSEDNGFGLLLEGKWGIETEFLRVTSKGNLALTPHPHIFGKKFENPNITVDFSESQLELISDPEQSIDKAYQSLENINRYVRNNLNDELLWPFSMPARLPAEEEIPIAVFDKSEKGRKNEIYRKGLALRYGKKMQMISGVHYNFSLADDLIEFLYQGRELKGQSKREFTDQLYLHIVRNLLRYRWLLLYLFGASPVYDDSYDEPIEREIEKIRNCCTHLPDVAKHSEIYATSLRMSQFGYCSAIHENSEINYNDLNHYLNNLQYFLKRQDSRFAQIGLYKDGKQVQLNDNILQKESEFYSPVRFKQYTKKGENILAALRKRGIKYLELRMLDLDPFSEIGISRESMYFTHLLILQSLLEENPVMEKHDLEITNKNHNTVALAGRKDGLKLFKKSEKILLKDWARLILEKCTLLAKALDSVSGGSDYQDTVKIQLAKIKDKNLIPSARIVNQMKKNKQDYIHFGIMRAKNKEE